MRSRFPLIFSCGLLLGRCVLGASVHYLDCSQGSDGADSLTPHTAWRTVAKANSYPYQPGDSLLLRRGSVCQGMLSPQGSGTEQASIHLGAYGQGALPEIVGGSEPAALNLHNQQYWEIENLELKGGSPYGIHIGGAEPLLRHFRISNVVVHDVTGTPLSKDSGLIVIAPDKNGKTRIDDVIVDGVTAYQTSEWAGIIVNGAGFDAAGHEDHGEHIEIRNSIVHDVAGDGILLARASHGVLEHNVAWHTGMQETQSIGTPNAIWEWRCLDCLVAYNEGFFSDSPGVDGGVFDIDYGSEDNTLTDNFGHDSQGYCISVFAADGASGNTIRSVIRHNTCIHNGRSPRLAKRQGAIFLSTWNGGKLNGVTIEDNTILWEPPIDAAAFESTAEFTGDLSNRISGNTIIAAGGKFHSSASGLDFEGNHNCGKVMASRRFFLQGKIYTDSPPQDPASFAVQGESDDAMIKPEEFCGCLQALLANSAGQSRNVGESEHRLGPAESVHDSLDSPLTRRWVLLGYMTAPGQPAAATSRSQLVLMESMMHQFGALGLGGVVVPARPASTGELEQWQTDWNLSPPLHMEAANAAELRKTFNLSAAPELLLISPSGEVAARWQSPVHPADVWLQIQKYLGTPAGMQQMPVCRNPVPH